MKILKVAVGNSSEAFVEKAFSNGLNIISSDDNNKGKTIVIQAMMFALGNDPTFPSSFKYREYYHYVEFEVDGRLYQICRTKDGFVLKQESSLWIFNNVSELKRHWDRNIFKLPSIIKNQTLHIVDPVLYLQSFFVGQDKNDTSNILHHGYYNKQDYIEMLFAFAGLGSQQLSQEKIDEIKRQISRLSGEKSVLLKQYKILKSKKLPVSYLSAESDRLAFGEKIARLEGVKQKITELRKTRAVAATRKSKWERMIEELVALNRTVSCGELRCMDCNSTNILFSVGGGRQTSYAFDVSTIGMRTEILRSIKEKIASYTEEIERLSTEINIAQNDLQKIMSEEEVSLESIVAYKKEMLSASDAQIRIRSIEAEVSTLKGQLVSSETAVQGMQEQRNIFLKNILGIMNEFHSKVDPNGNIIYTSLFTQQDQVYSGSEGIVFYLARLYALRGVLNHTYPIVVDSFRTEDLSSAKEDAVLGLFKELPNQIIFTTTLKAEEFGKYDTRNDVHHINYKDHLPSKILTSSYVEEFNSLLGSLSIKLPTPKTTDGRTVV